MASVANVLSSPNRQSRARLIVCSVQIMRVGGYAASRESHETFSEQLHHVVDDQPSYSLVADEVDCVLGEAHRVLDSAQ